MNELPIDVLHWLVALSPIVVLLVLLFNARQCWGFTMTTDAVAHRERVR